MPSLLLEIFSEEIPAGMQVKAAADFANSLAKRIDDVFGGNHHVEHWSTPRRIGFRVAEISGSVETKAEEVRGPKTSAPEQALKGFLGKYGVDKSALDEKDGYYYLTVQPENKSADEHIKDVIEQTLNAFVWPKSMRWGESVKTWVRPMVSILCLFGSKTIEAAYGDIVASNKTQGHRFMSNNKPFAVKNFEDYESKLKEQSVVLSHENRKESVLHQINSILRSYDGLQLIEDKGLLNEIAGLVENPFVHIGKIDAEFMELPREVLQIALKVHQRYLMLEDEQGNLAPYFVIVSNIEATDGGESLVKGNEKVLRARLSDAMFFYDLDKKSKLEEKLEKLKKVTFHKDIGSVFDKVSMLEEYSLSISEFMKVDTSKAKMASKLCKSDLVSEMVKEFPELQGVMGGYYAANDGLPNDVASAISDHYKPVGPNDSVPANNIGKVVSIADKLVTLNKLFEINVKPTGSKDPFALRRAANGIIRMVGNDNIESFFEFMKSKNMLRSDVEQYIREREIL